MEDESIQGVANNYEKQIPTLEIKVVDISCKMSIFMMSLESMFGPSMDFGSSKSISDQRVNWKIKLPRKGSNH